MATNTSTNYAAAVRRQLSKDVLPLTQKYLVVYQFADKKKMEKGAGLTWTATRFNRLPLPFAPLSEGVAPVGENLGISQATGIAIQWGDKVMFTDIAVTTTMYDLIQQSKEKLALQIGETQERNTYLNLCSGTQVNYVNQRGARASLVAGDVLDPTTVQRTVSNMKNVGAPLFNGQTGADVKRDIEHGAKAVTASPKTHEHYVSVGSPLVFNDFASNATVVQAWSYSDVTRLYINEAGYWRGMHFCESNMVPSWIGVSNSGITATGGTAGALATGTYALVITGSDTQNQYESRIYQVITGISVTGPTGSIGFTTPSTANFTYSAYIAFTGSTSPTNLALCASGPTSGPYAGQAVQLAPSTAVVLTGLGVYGVPPAAPATGVTVFPTFVFGKDAFACLELEDVTWTSLFEADKSDPLNQLRVVGWKQFWGVVITNNQFMARIESSASNTGTFG